MLSLNENQHSIELIQAQRLDLFTKFNAFLTDIIIEDCLSVQHNVDVVICNVIINSSSNIDIDSILLWVNNISSDKANIGLQKFIEPTELISGIVVLSVSLNNNGYRSSISDTEYFQYSLPNFFEHNDSHYSSRVEETIHIYTREKRKDCGVSPQALTSNHLNPNPLAAVDNTGNICVWPAEGALLCAVLRSERYRNLLRAARVLELGGGQAALAGLGVAASGLSREVVLSDGNGLCVANQVMLAAASVAATKK